MLAVSFLFAYLSLIHIKPHIQMDENYYIEYSKHLY